MRTGDAEFLAKRVDQQRARLCQKVNILAVDIQLDVHLFISSSLRRANERFRSPP